MRIYNAVPGEPLPLGHRWENNALRIAFDISAWVDAFGAGTVRLLHQRQGDAAPYPVSLTRTDADGTPNNETGTRVLWDVSNADTAQVCHFGRAELRYYAGREGAEEFLAKSDIWKTEVRDALGGAQADAPEEASDWLNALLEATDNIEANVAAAQEAREQTQAVAKQTEEQFLYIDRDPESETYGFLMWVHDVKTPEVIASGDGWTFDTEATLTVFKNRMLAIFEEMGEYKDAIKRLVLKDANISIPARSFWYSGLTSAIIGNGVTAISGSAFSQAYSLTSVAISDSVTRISSYAFDHCASLAHIAIPDSVTAIGGFAFRNCRALTEIIIPYGVAEIADSTFETCISLSSVTIPVSVRSIGTLAFKDCRALTAITLPDGMAKISEYTFSGCSSLASVTIPDGVQTVRSYAFASCSSLTSIAIPVSLRRVENYAFSGCVNLRDVYYKGSEEQKNAIYIDSGSAASLLTQATWHYNWEG